MKRIQAFRYVLRPTREQEQAFRQFVGSRRFVYNQGLELQNRRRNDSKRRLNYESLCRELKSWKSKEAWTWLNEAPSQSLQQGLKDLCVAFDRMARGLSAHPRFKRRGPRDSFRYPQGVKLDPHADRVSLPKIGWVRYRNSQPVLVRSKSHPTGGVRVSVLWLEFERGSQRRTQHTRGRACRARLWNRGVRPCAQAGTLRNASALRARVVGIPVVYGGEEVNMRSRIWS